MANKDQPIGEWSVVVLRRVLLYTRSSNLSPVVVMPPFKEWVGRMYAEEGRNKCVFPSRIRCVVRAWTVYTSFTHQTGSREAVGWTKRCNSVSLSFSLFPLPPQSSRRRHYYHNCYCCCCFYMVGLRMRKIIYSRALRFLDLHWEEKKPSSELTSFYIQAQQQF